MTSAHLKPRLFTFVELRSFKLNNLLTDDEYRKIQSALMTNPESGPVMSGTGGFRKIRWAPEGQGKSGEVGVIYYNRSQASGRLYMAYIFPKNVSDNLSNAQKNVLKALSDGLK